MGILVPLVLLCCKSCAQSFAICRSCYRCHVYCSKSCSEAARRLSVKAAKKRFRQSEEGRLDHRDRERERRSRRKAESRPFLRPEPNRTSREARVGDHTSNVPAPIGTMLPFSLPVVHEAMEVNSEDTSIEADVGRNEVKAEQPPAAPHDSTPLPRKAKHRCAICGRYGYLVESFPEKLFKQHSPRCNPVLRR
jgi:hypothetical protein